MIAFRYGFWLALALIPGLAHAEGAPGCAKLRWNLDAERAQLSRPDKPVVANGGALSYGIAVTLRLANLADAALPKPPERSSKLEKSFAGHFELPAPRPAGVYAITLADGGWIDILDEGRYMPVVAYTSAMGCEGSRRSVKFELPSRPLTLQISGVANKETGIIVTPEK